jgi:hypothetical protein
MSIKNHNANEIARAMTNQLNDASFTSLYKKADDSMFAKFKAKVDVVLDNYKQKKIDKPTAKNELVLIRNEVNELPEGRIPILEYIDWAEKQLELAVAPPADDKEITEEEKPEHTEECACMECADKGSVVAADFAIKRMIKLADALDKTGFSGIAELIDESIEKIAKAKQKGRTVAQWIKHFEKHSDKAAEKFKKIYEGALEYAKAKKGLKGPKAEEYAMRTALDKMPKNYFKEPTKVHGPGKSGPLTKK